MIAAVKDSSRFETMANDATIAVVAGRRQRMNCALKTVKVV